MANCFMRPPLSGVIHVTVEILVGIVAALLAGAISGLSGFGYALVSVPLLMLVFDPATVVVVLSLIGIPVNVLVVLDSWRAVEVRTVLALLPWSALGLVAGTEILLLAKPAYIKLAAGILVVSFAVALLSGMRLPGARGRWGPVVAGASTGAMATSTGLGGPPIVMLFAARNFGRDTFRASIAAYLLALGTTTLCLLLIRGVVEVRHLWISILLLPAALVGKAIGTSVVRRLPDKAFRKIALGIILLTGLVGFATSGWELL